MSSPLCFFLGSASSFNVRRLAQNLGKMLGTQHDLHVVTTRYRTLSPALGPAYEIFGDDSEGLLSGVRALEDYLDHHHPAVVVQLTDPPIHGTIVSALGRAHGLPTVYRYSGDRFREYRVARGRQKAVAFGLGAILGRVPLHLATDHVALGPVGRNRLVKRGVSPDAVTILPPTVDPSQFSNATPVDGLAPPDGDLVLTVGRLSHLKGVEILERVIPEVLQRSPKSEFLHVGSVERSISVPKQYTDRVTLAGPVPPDEIPGYMAAASVVLHPSLSEGVPRVLLEALATGTPVVARDVGDVAMVTENTFTTETECTDLVSLGSDLPVDDVEPFTVSSSKPRYRRFFDRFE